MHEVRYQYVTLDHRVDASGDSFHAPFDSDWVHDAHGLVESERTGSDNLRWRDHIKMHIQAGTPFSGIRRTMAFSHPGMKVSVLNDYGPSYPNNRREVNWYRARGWVGIVPPSWTGDPTISPLSAENSALGTFYNKARKVQTSFQGGVFAGELLETLRMIRSPAKAFRSSIDSYLGKLKRGSRLSRKGRQALLSDTWLEYSFGWAPLMHDIRDGMATLARKRNTLRLFSERISASQSTDQLDLLHSAQGYISTPILSYICNSRITQRASVRFIGEVLAEPSTTVIPDATLWGFNLSSFVPTLYELLPWSFLIDYFSNLGTVINAWSLQHSSLGWVIKTSRIDYRTEMRGGWDVVSSRFFLGSSATSIVWSGSSSNLTYLSRKVERTPVYNVGLPRLTFRLPGMSTKWINMTALVSSRSFRL